MGHDRALVVGSWAPLLTLGSPHGAAVVWYTINDTPRPWHDRVTHLLIDQRKELPLRRTGMAVFTRGGSQVSALPGPEIQIHNRPLELYIHQPAP